jgi:glycerophosphoryl diester phosphodiesterase
LDVRRSKDGHLVILHDDDLKRTTDDGEGKVSDKDLKYLKSLDSGKWFDATFAGQRIPTLDEVFALVKSRGHPDTLVAVDIKIDDTKVEADIVKLAKKHDVLSRIICIGTAIDSSDVRKRLREADAKVPVAVLAQTADDLPRALAAKDSDWAYLRFVPTADQVSQARKSGKKVIVVGKPVMAREVDNWAKARDAGVDAILTDYPLDCRLSWRGKK